MCTMQDITAWQHVITNSNINDSKNVIFKNVISLYPAQTYNFNSD